MILLLITISILLFVTIVYIQLCISRRVRRRRLRIIAAQQRQILVISNRQPQPVPTVFMTEAGMNATRINAPIYSPPQYDQVLAGSSGLPPSYTEAYVPSAPNEVVLKIQP